MYFVKRFVLVCIIAADASYGIGRKKDGIRGGSTTTSEAHSTETNTTDVSGEILRTGITTPDPLTTDERLEVGDIESFESLFNPYDDSTGSPFIALLGADV